MLLRFAKLVLPSLFLSRADSTEEVCGIQGGSCSASDVVEAVAAESFLQNRFFNNPKRTFGVTAQGDEQESVNLINLQDQEGLFRRSVARAQSFRAHAFLLDRVIEALKYNETADGPKRGRKKKGGKLGKGKGKGKGKDGESLEDMVDGFIDAQSGSKDACHSQLFEARHQLNQLHDIVINLAEEVNATELMIVAFDKSLQEKLKDLEELDKWKGKELDKCQKKKDEAVDMFRKLSNEMEEMRQIASPDVSMDVKGRIVHDLSFLQDALASWQNESKPLRGPLGNLGISKHDFDKGVAAQSALMASRPKKDITEEMNDFSGLVEQTTKASIKFMTCKKRKKKHSQLLQLQHSEEKPRKKKSKKGGCTGAQKSLCKWWGKTKSGCSGAAEVSVKVGDAEKDISPSGRLKDKMKDSYLCSKVNPGYHGIIWLTCSKGKLTSDDAVRCFKGEEEGDAEEEEDDDKPESSEECLEQKKELEDIYVKAYVELSRLMTEYDELANSTACHDAVNTKYKDKRAPLGEAADDLSAKIAQKIKGLESLKPRLESATNAETMLRKQVKILNKQCKDLGPTVSDLDNVRDAIRALSECPGLSRSKFSLPKWTGEWVRITQKKKGQSDDELDKLMNEACDKAEEGTRAAEVGEIQEATVLGIPRTNTGKVPLIGTCPNCEGKDDKDCSSGHLRKCWRTGKSLSLKDMSEDCLSGDRVVLCVKDNSDIREIPGEEEEEEL